MSKSTFTPEKVRELSEKLYHCGLPYRVDVITEWLEQNHPEPVVVGLSDEQICELADYISDANYEHHFKSKSEVITEWLKTQTFAQPEVKEVVVGLSDEQLFEICDLLEERIHEDGCNLPTADGCMDVIVDCLKTKTFVQPGDYEEKYISLYDDHQSLIVDKMLVDKELEQLKSQQDITDGGWRGKYGRLHVDYNLLLDDLKDYYSSQAIQMTYQKMYNELHDCFVDLQKELEQLKSQQFMPDWNTAPDWANWLAQDETGDWFYFEKKPTAGEDGWMHNNGTYESTYAFVKNWQQTLQERPQPTPKVEVGQVWRHASEGEGGDDYEVTEVVTLEGKFKIGDDWQEDVVMITYENAAQDVYRRILSDFLAKFEQVQS